LFGVTTDERLYEGSLAYAWRANDTDNDRGCLFGQAVDERDVEALFFDLYMSA
jgi:hypothetical protein